MPKRERQPYHGNRFAVCYSRVIVANISASVAVRVWRKTQISIMHNIPIITWQNWQLFAILILDIKLEAITPVAANVPPNEIRTTSWDWVSLAYLTMQREIYAWLTCSWPFHSYCMLDHPVNTV